MRQDYGHWFKPFFYFGLLVAGITLIGAIIYYIIQPR